MVGLGEVEDVTPRPSASRAADAVSAPATGPGVLQPGRRLFLRVAAADTTHPSAGPAGPPGLAARQGRRRAEQPGCTRLGARGRGRAQPGGRLGGRGRGRAPERVGGRGRARGAASPHAAPAAPAARGLRQGPEGAMAAGSITTLPALPEDGGSGAFPPGHFKDPKRLYCKNGGFFLRIHPDGRVDGVREKSDPHSECAPPPLSSSRADPTPVSGGNVWFLRTCCPRRFRVHRLPPLALSCGFGLDGPGLWAVPVSLGEPAPGTRSRRRLAGRASLAQTTCHVRDAPRGPRGLLPARSATERGGAAAELNVLGKTKLFFPKFYA